MSPHSENLHVGATVGDARYSILDVLGQGSQATTYEAIDKTDGTLVALKEFSVRGASSWKDVELAEREANVLSSLNFELLPRYHAHFEENGRLYLVMEKVVGTPLSELSKEGRMGQEDVHAFLRDAALTLDYLHSRAPPIIHRDIKPGNVIRREDGRFVLVDFGSVQHVLKPEGGSTVVGTFGYMAPEQFQGRALPSTDVFGVGATALALLTGRSPDALPHKGLAIDVASALGKNVDPAWVSLLSAATSPDPDARPTSLGQLLTTFERTFATRDSSGRSSKDGKRAEARREEQRSRHEERTARREEARSRRHESRHERGQRRHQQRYGGAAVPNRSWPRAGIPLLMIAVIWALLIARVATFFVMQVALPTLLSLLAVVFGAELRRAAATCLEEGRKAQRVLRAASRKVRAGGVLSSTDETDPQSEASVDPKTTRSPPKTRVATDEVVDAEGVAVDNLAGEEAVADSAARHRARGRG